MTSRAVQGVAALSGVLAAAVGLGVGDAVAGLVGPQSSPVVAVGGAVVDSSPHAVTEFAIHTFGHNDKLALHVGTLVVTAVLAALLGVLALRRRRLAAAGFMLAGVLAAAVALGRPNSAPVDTLPSLLAAAAGIVALGILLTQLDAWRRAEPPRDTTSPGPMPGRRFVLVAGGITGFAILSGGAGNWLRHRFEVGHARETLQIPQVADPTPMPTGLAGVDGLSSIITPAADFYRVDTALVAPQISPDDWSLRIHGRVDRELRFTFAQLAARTDLISADITLACVSNEVGGPLAGGARWVGVPLANLLTEAGVEAGADQVVTRSADGWTCGTPTADCMTVPNAMLALSMNGKALPVNHGFPVRMLVPGLYGYVSATKWIVDIELAKLGDYDPYWVARGWDTIAPMQLFSRIDTPQSGASLKAGTVAIAGIAYTGNRDITLVEVRIDDGDWMPATLSPEISPQLWRQWLLRWTATSGDHEIAVRATDSTGQVQSERRAQPYPNASSGWHTISVTVR